MPHFAKTAFVAATSLLLSMPTLSATQIGPSPYLSAADSPFSGLFANPEFYLDDFEDGLLNTPGVTASSGQVFGPSTFTDSVDADDGVIDGSGRGGHSYWSGPTYDPITFTFSADALGTLPTHAGLVVTHTVGNGAFSFFDANDDLITSFTLSITASPNGETSADRFIGVINETGISKITTAGILEMDHLQYYAAPVPVPAAAWLFASAVIGIGGMLRRRAR
jgi:hypothetical protein